jgi:hypothetical protein
VDSGLATVGRLADEAAVSAFDRFSLVWGGGAGERILSRVEELGRALEAEPAPVEHRAPETPPEPPPLNLVQQSEPPMLSPVSVR